MRKSGRRAKLLSTLAILMLAIVLGCTPQPGPDVAVRDWFQALAAQDGLKLGDLTCTAAQNDLATGGTFLNAFNLVSALFLGGEKPRYGVDGLTYQTTSSSGTDADVRVTGQVRVAIGVASQAQDLATTVHVIRERDRWRVCWTPSSSAGGTSNTATTAPVGQATVAAAQQAGVHATAVSVARQAQGEVSAEAVATRFVEAAMSGDLGRVQALSALVDRDAGSNFDSDWFPSKLSDCRGIPVRYRETPSIKDPDPVRGSY